MKLKFLIFSCLAGMMLFSAQSRADIVTFTLDTIPDGVPSYSVDSSFATLNLFGASNAQAGNNIANRTFSGTRGLTFDSPSNGVSDMYAINTSYDRDVTITGYTVAGSSGNFDGGVVTFTFGGTSGLSASNGTKTLETPIFLAAGNTLNISESSGSDPTAGGAVITSITVEAIPEPASFAFLGLGGLALASRRRRRN